MRYPVCEFPCYYAPSSTSESYLRKKYPMSYATSSDGVRIFYTTTGQGEPLVLSHGTTHTWESWHDLGFIDGLEDQFQLILIDSRGHGQSDKPHTAAAYDMERQADDVVAVVDDLGVDRFHLFGYSLGAVSGFHLAAQAPERIRSLVAYGGDPYAPSPNYIASIEQDLAILRQGMQTWVDLMENIGVFNQYPKPTARKERLLAADAEALIASVMASVDNPGIADALERLTMPCLIIAGGQAGGNDLAHRAARDLPLADFVSIAGIGHAMANGQIILPYVHAFYERFSLVSG
jgi:pimeloyl-ACP methyl ester carboxylesterase